MKLLRLHLKSYGPFTGHELDFSGGEPGLQVVYGRNEAGKSTTLRALKALLYGIPARTRDDFVHSMPTLRVGGTFQTADGHTLELYRRKGNKATLLDADGNPLEGEPLRALLGGLDEASFERLFGIDHHTLVDGGEALLREHGREAEALFGAGLGSTGLHGVLQQLQQDEAELFAARASKPRINAGLREFEDIVRAQREAGLSAREWEDADKHASTARAELARLAAALGEATRRRSRLERIRRTLPGLARRHLLNQQLSHLGPVPALAESFRPRYEAAVQRLRAGCEQRDAATAQLANLRERSAGLAGADDLLTHAETLDELREQLGSYRKARKDQPALLAQRHGLAEQIGKLRDQLGISPALAERTMLERLLPALRHKRRAAELGPRQAALEDGLSKAQAAFDTATHQLEQVRAQLAGIPAPPPLDGLRQAVDAARAAGELDAAIEAAHQRRARQQATLRIDLAKLGRWPGELAALRATCLPADETLHRFRDAYANLDKQAERAAERFAEARREATQAQQALDALQRAGSVPTEEALEQIRTQRDHGWKLLRRQWLLAEDVADEARAYAGEQALPDAFEHNQLRADEIADRLRREAQRVHEQAETRARLEAAARKAEEAQQALASLQAERADVETAWQALWRALDIAPLSVAEMTGWLSRARQLCEKAGEDDQQAEDLARLDQRRDTLVATLRAATAAIDALGERGSGVSSGDDPARGPARDPEARPLTALLKRTETVLATLERRERERTRLLERIDELDADRCRHQAELASAQRAVAEWRQQWQALTSALGLADTAAPAEVGDYLAALEEVCRLADTAADLDERIRTIDQDSTAFETRVAELAHQLAPAIAAQPVAEVIAQLSARLEAQKEAKNRLDELERQIRDSEEMLRQARLDIERAEHQLDALCAEAECPTREALPAAIDRAEHRRSLEQALTETTEALLATGDGLTLAALEAEADGEGADADAVRAQLEAVQAHIDDELRPEQEHFLTQKVEAERTLAAMGGDDRAAELAESAQAVLAAIRRDAEQYVRLRLARRILHDEIERFRRAHRDPMLARASGHLAMLTCGAFRGVETDFDENDQPVLIGRRATDEGLRVEAMSTGTRDQLYLALRLAAIEQYLDNAPPIPFVVDDILIHFDDERAAATLECLARLAERTQVVLFTHHRRDYEMARRLADENPQVCALELG